MSLCVVRDAYCEHGMAPSEQKGKAPWDMVPNTRYDKRLMLLNERRTALLSTSNFGVFFEVLGIVFYSVGAIGTLVCIQTIVNGVQKGTNQIYFVFSWDYRI